MWSPSKSTLVLGWLLAVAACGLCGCGSPDDPTLAADSEPRDPASVVARVNGVSITERRLSSIVEAELLLPGQQPEARTREPIDRRLDGLRLAIREEVVYQAAVGQVTEVPEAEIERRLEVVRSQFPNEEAFLEHLARAGSSIEQMREQVRRTLLIRAYAAQVTSALDVDEVRLEQLYDEQSELARSHDQVRVAQILVRLRPQDSPERRQQAETKINQAHARAVAGEDFAQLARTYSESPLAERGGDMGYLPRGRMLAQFETVIFSTPIGAISDVFETPHGLNVIKVLGRKSTEPESDEEIRRDLRLLLAREQNSETLREHIDRLEEQARVEILDPGLHRPRTGS